MSGYDDLPHDAQVEIQRMSDKWFAERDAYALRVAEAVREACAAECNKEVVAPGADGYEMTKAAAWRVATRIRSLDLHAILKGVER